MLPALFALGDKVMGNPQLATFAAFGSFALLLLVDFTGPMRERLQWQLGLGIVGAVFVCLGTLASRNAWVGAALMVVVGFGVLFAGIVSSVLAGASTSLLLAFVLPVSVAGSPSTIPDRLAGWVMASVVAILATWLLWPAPPRNPLRAPASAACRALATRLRTDVAWLLGGESSPSDDDHASAIAAAAASVKNLHQVFLATPYRPTGLSLSSRTVVRLVDELNWLVIVIQAGADPKRFTINPAACAVKMAAADVLENCADLLADSTGPVQGLRAALTELTEALAGLERQATDQLPVPRLVLPPRPGESGLPGESGQPAGAVNEVITALEPSFRAQELSFAVSLIGRNIDLMVAADRRNWIDRLLGRQPQGVAGSLSAAQERAAAHVEPHSVWLHNSVRGAVGLGLAVLIADLTDVQHGFWVVLGTLSVLRSNALNTGQNVLRGLLGTVAGFVIGAALISAIGNNETFLWFLLPIVVFLAGIAPAAISFAGGQAAFTITVVILFNIIDPAGWRVGLVRIEDVAIGCAVSLVVGVLFWPRGAGAALSRSLADAYSESARYLSNAVAFGMVRCDSSIPSPEAPTEDAIRAAAAGRRLDDTFRSYLSERGSKPVQLSDVTRLVTGVAGIRLAGDAVLALWQRDEGEAIGDREAARAEILRKSEGIQTWYDDLAECLTSGHHLRDPLDRDVLADEHLIEAVRQDFRGDDGKATETAVRMIWTADHLDAARRLQAVLVEPAREASKQRAPMPADARPPVRWVRRLSASLNHGPA